MKEATRLAQTGLGARGDSPAASSENDEGELAFQVGALKGKVVLNFGQPVASVGMSPEQARELARTLRLWANRANRLQYR